MKPLEQIIYRVRDFFWNYPELLFFGKSSFSNRFNKFYLSFRPFSHLFSSTFIALLVTIFMLSNYKIILGAENKTLIEGVLVGVDEEGNKNVIQKLNPLVISSSQIEKDLSELVYESLVEVDVFGNVENIIAETIAPNQSGDNFRIKLREDIFWHDSTDQNPHQLTARDVEATFKLLERLDFNTSTKSIYSTVANKRIKFIPIDGDDFRFEFQLDGAIPNFYELLTFKILPAKYIQSLDSNNILTSSPEINRNPVGTGKFQLASASNDYIQLRRNDNYHDPELVTQVQNIRFKFFLDEESIVKALESGQIHSAAGLTTQALLKLKDDKNITLLKTGTIYTQYYAIYFNLGQTGAEELQDKLVRQAISSAINRRYMIEILEGEAEEAFGPIGKNSFAFSSVNRFTYSIDKANALLAEAGWAVDPKQGLRFKDGKPLEFELVALDNVDRNKVSQSIVEDLKEIGIKVNLVRKPISDLNQQNVLPRNFDALLFSATTFIDPDRFEFFHSTQATHPGLNLSSYASEEKTVKINEDKKVVTVPEVDLRLEQGRRLLDHDARVREYLEFQRIIAEEVPVVFLYHPVLNYAINQRVKNVNISNANTLEERFKGISDWEIKL